MEDEKMSKISRERDGERQSEVSITLQGTSSVV